ncbi:MAG: hypothetical protein JW730_06970 [Anaerolineales bacterium]|nr:hypothetical protein [Anaerolineales bacterium]
MKKLLKTLFQIIALVVLLAILTPIVYFAWRMGQPMDLPEFNGLTYYQVREWKKIASEDLIAKYETSHPSKEYKGWGNRLGTCIGGDIPIALFVSVRSVIMAWQSEELRLQLVDHGMPDEPVTFWNFLPSLWNTYEKLTLSDIEYSPHTAVIYCRIQPDIPTLEEFETMKRDHETHASANSQVQP